MDGPQPHRIQPALVIWQKRNLHGTCLSVTPDHIEICLEVNGITVDRHRFTDAGAASAFAIETMHAYSAEARS